MLSQGCGPECNQPAPCELRRLLSRAITYDRVIGSLQGNRSLRKRLLPFEEAAPIRAARVSKRYHESA